MALEEFGEYYIKNTMYLDHFNKICVNFDKMHISLDFHS